MSQPTVIVTPAGAVQVTVDRREKGDKGDPGDTGPLAGPAEIAAQQGFWPVYSATPPEQTEMYGYPVVWMTSAAVPTPVPALPPAPLWDDNLTQVSIPSGVVGVEYRDHATGLVLPQGTVVLGTKGAETTIDALALPGYTLPTAYSWRHRFLDPAKSVLVGSDTFAGAATPTVVGRALNNALGGSGALTWRGVKMTANPFWVPPNVNWNGGGYAGTGLSGAGTLKTTPLVSVNPTVATSASGGTLAAGTYYYMVTAQIGVSESGNENQKSIVTTGSTSSNTITWAAVAGATAIRIWRATASGGEKLLATLAGSATSYVDDGSATPGTDTPPYLQSMGSTCALQLATPWQRIKFVAAGITTSGTTATVTFRLLTAWSIYFIGYYIRVQNDRLTFGLGSPTPDSSSAANVSDVRTFTHTPNGEWDCYLIGDTITAIGPTGVLYTATINPYVGSSSTTDRVTGNGVAIAVAPPVEVSNLRVYEIGQ